MADTGIVYRDPGAAPSIHMDLDTDRILDVVNAALATIDEFLDHPDYKGSKEKLVGDVQKIVQSRMISLEKMTFPLWNSKMNDLILVVYFKKKKVSVQSNRFPTKRAQLNSIMKTIG